QGTCGFRRGGSGIRRREALRNSAAQSACPATGPMSAGRTLETPMNLPAAFLCLTLAAAPSAALAQPQNLKSSSYLADDGAKDSWSYRDPKADVTKYKSFIVEPTVVSNDAAAKWGKATEADKQKY